MELSIESRHEKAGFLPIGKQRRGKKKNLCILHRQVFIMRDFLFPDHLLGADKNRHEVQGVL